MSYILADKKIYANVDTSKLGYLKLSTDQVSVDNRSDLIRFIIPDIELDSRLITHHCIAIVRILDIIGEVVDVNIEVPSISIYLAAKSYTGKNYLINALKDILQKRMGGVSFTVTNKK